MLRGLIIRQVFILVDLTLVVLVFFTAGLVVHRLFWPEPVAMASTNLDQPVVDDNGDAYLQQVASRNAYDEIRTNRLFGPAGEWSGKPTEAAAPVVEQDSSIEETALNLRLIGTLATFPKDPLGSANIENQDERKVLNVAVGEDILEGVSLEEVYPREVFILNKGKREKLTMDEEEDDMAMARPAPQPENSHRPDQVNINRQEFIQDLYMNYADLVTKIKPEYYRDASGKIVGLTAQNITQVPLAKKLQLNEGDVLTSVNNETIDSEQKVMEMIQKYRNSNSFRIGVLRNGKPHVITYRLD
jgi:type II secretion system protein C